jgi:hypothetical protein
VSQGEHIITVDWRARLLGVNIASAPSQSLNFNTNSGKIVFNVQLIHKLIPEKEYDLSHIDNFIFSLQLNSEIVLDQIKVIAKDPLDEAIDEIYEELSETISENKRIAILSIDSNDTIESSYIVYKLIRKFVNSNKYIVVDGKDLDVVREEQKIQLSGQVDDQTAVSIGRLLEANVIIVGSINDSGISSRRLSLKALDVETGQIISMASHRF